MEFTAQIQKHLNTYHSALHQVKELEKEVDLLKETLEKSQSARSILAKQNYTLRKAGKVLDGLDEDRLFDQEATLSFQRSLDGMRILKVRSLNLGMEMHTADKGPLLQEGVRKSLGRVECPAEA